MTARKHVSSGSPYEPKVGISRAIRVGDRIVVSGTAPIWPDGYCAEGSGEQTTRCLEIIVAAIEEAGGRRQDVIRTRIFMTEAADPDEVAAAHAEMLGDVRPVSTMLFVDGFLDPSWKVEIEAEAQVR